MSGFEKVAKSADTLVREKPSIMVYLCLGVMVFILINIGWYYLKKLVILPLQNTRSRSKRHSKKKKKRKKKRSYSSSDEEQEDEEQEDEDEDYSSSSDDSY